MTLPNLQVQYSCGNCGIELANEAGTQTCYYCGLEYLGDPAGRPEATFTEQVNPCGSPGHPPISYRQPFRAVGGVVEQWRTTVTTYEPCSLPRDHDNQFHYYYPRHTFIYDDGAPEE